MKFGIMTLAFYGSATLPKMLQNTGPYVDKIYLSHSSVPWSEYNKYARSNYKSEFTSEILKKMPFAEKIVFVEGVWKTEELQRQHILELAKSEGIDYLIIQDLDEFYMPDQFLLNIDEILNNPNFPVYSCPWVKFWKSTDYIMEARYHDGKKDQVVSLCPNFAVNVNWPGIKFQKNRLVDKMEGVFALSGLCLHLSWVLSDEEVLKKISTWGHSNDFDYMTWYKHKWLAWQPKTKYIGIFSRADYNKAVKNIFELPKELKDFSVEGQKFIPLNIIEKFYSYFLDIKSIIKVMLVNFFFKQLKRNSL